jgi:hypothetical protein
LQATLGGSSGRTSLVAVHRDRGSGVHRPGADLVILSLPTAFPGIKTMGLCRQRVTQVVRSPRQHDAQPTGLSRQVINIKLCPITGG